MYEITAAGVASYRHDDFIDSIRLLSPFCAIRQRHIFREPTIGLQERATSGQRQLLAVHIDLLPVLFLTRNIIFSIHEQHLRVLTM